MSDSGSERFADLVARARLLSVPGRRALLGITGAPGAGKSFVAERLVAALGDSALLVSMDGFHLAGAELQRLDRTERKGAPDTFDALGYVALLARLRRNEERVVYAPLFDRSLEEPIACAVPVPREVPLVVTEGNYLLVSEGDWAGVRPQLDACWFIDPGEKLRVDRLVARHERYGRSLEAAQGRALGSDQRNAEVVAATRDRADLII